MLGGFGRPVGRTSVAAECVWDLHRFATFGLCLILSRRTSDHKLAAVTFMDIRTESH